MQSSSSRPNDNGVASRAGQSSSARSTSPALIMGGGGTSKTTAAHANAMASSTRKDPLSLSNQLGSLSLSLNRGNVSATSSPAKALSRPSHRKTQSSTLAAGVGGGGGGGGSSSSSRERSTSPVKAVSSISRHGTSKSISDVKPARSASPTKLGAAGRSSSSKSATGAGHGLSKSVGARNTRDPGGVVAAGGLGRMDIAGKDWDSRSNSSAGNSPQKKKLSASVKSYDRFIPSRENSSSSGGAIEHSGNQTAKANANIDDSFEGDRSQASEGDAAASDGFDDSPAGSPQRPGHQQQESSDQAHTAELSSSLGIELGRRILSFSAEPPPASNEHSSLLAAYARGEGGLRSGAGHQTAQAASQRRRIATTAERVLDAPGLVDDYYLNLLDWSTTNLVAIALAESVYIWNAESGEVGCLCSVSSGEDDESEEIVCSVKFSDDGSYLAIGCASGAIQIYDLASSTRIRTMLGHATRVPTLSWSGAILSSGSRDGAIVNSDVRVAQHRVAEMRGHRAEVCGLAWRKDTAATGASAGPMGGSSGGMGLLASGGNDNVVNVWDGRMLSAPKMVKNNHTAAVKAIAWCPWQSSLLATGGGSSDRTIHFWNTTTSARLNSLVTPSQVTSIIFNPHAREVLSSHGFPDNQLSIWSFPTLSKVVDITQAHDTRVLHSCLSPDGTTVATASSDENLKFWKVFDVPKKSVSGGSSAGMAFAGKGSALGGAGEGKGEHDIGRRGRTGINIR